MQVEADYGRPKDGLGRVVSQHDLQALAVERGGGAKGAYAGVKRPNPAMGNQPGPLALLVKVQAQEGPQQIHLPIASSHQEHLHLRQPETALKGVAIWPP